MKLIPTFRSDKAVRNCKFCMFFWTMLIMFWSVDSLADEVVFKFKSPSFNGVNTSSHYLTIQNQEFNRKEALKAEIKALQDEIERDKENTTLARFVRNLESRIYAQITKNLVDSMFEENGALTGTAELEGATIYWVKDVTAGTITVTITEEDGTITELVVPLTGFGF